ncbi:MAG: hypothetical protein M0R70_12390 [Nitrospirae bacterium]|nr:hypothetical protein [Nitrospirota bacterium]
MKNKQGSLVITLVIALSVLSGIAVFSDFLLASPAAAVAQDDWKKEFEEICSQTQDAMLGTPEELKDLVSRCDALRPRIEKLDETQKKIYLKRLHMCRDLFNYALESKAGK